MEMAREISFSSLCPLISLILTHSLSLLHTFFLVHLALFLSLSLYVQEIVNHGMLVKMLKNEKRTGELRGVEAKRAATLLFIAARSSFLNCRVEITLTHTTRGARTKFSHTVLAEPPHPESRATRFLKVFACKKLLVVTVSPRENEPITVDLSPGDPRIIDRDWLIFFTLITMTTKNFLRAKTLIGAFSRCK